VAQYNWLGPRGPTLLTASGNQPRAVCSSMCLVPGGCWGGRKLWALEGAGAHERSYLGIGHGLIEAVALCHLS
jgi:hypothetical protein